MRNLNAITPETETTIALFLGPGARFRRRQSETTTEIFQQIKTAFLEDVAVFSAQQRNLTIIANPPQIDINADAGRSRRGAFSSRLHDEEQAAAAVAAE